MLRSGDWQASYPTLATTPSEINRGARRNQSDLLDARLFFLLTDEEKQ